LNKKGFPWRHISNKPLLVKFEPQSLKSHWIQNSIPYFWPQDINGPENLKYLSESNFWIIFFLIESVKCCKLKGISFEKIVVESVSKSAVYGEIFHFLFCWVGRLFVDLALLSSLSQSRRLFRDFVWQALDFLLPIQFVDKCSKPSAYPSIGVPWASMFFRFILALFWHIQKALL